MSRIRNTSYRPLVPLLLAAALVAGCHGAALGTDAPTEGTGGTGTTPPLGLTYVRSYGLTSWEIGRSLAPLPDGGLVVGGALNRGNRVLLLEANGQPRVEVLQDESRTQDFRFGVLIESEGAVFTGLTSDEGSGTDILVRHVQPNGTVAWERSLDAVEWGGGVQVVSGGIHDSVKSVHAVYDSTGAWRGVWVIGRAFGYSPITNEDGTAIAQMPGSATAWYIDRNGVVGARARFVSAEDPAFNVVVVDSAAVLASGSLAVLTNEEYGRGPLILREVRTDGTVGEPFEVDPDYAVRLHASGNELYAIGQTDLARVDLPARRIEWERSLPDALRVPAGQRVAGSLLERVSPSGQSQQVVVAQEGSAERYRVSDGVSLGRCTLPATEYFVALRGLPNGLLRALIARPNTGGGYDELRSIVLRDDCTELPGTAESFGVWSRLQRVAGEAPIEFSRDGTRIDIASAYRVRRLRSGPELELGIASSAEPPPRVIETIVVDGAGRVAMVGAGGVQRMSATGEMRDEIALPGAFHAAADDAGRIWITGGPVTEATDTGYCAGAKVVLLDGRAECRTIEGYDLNDWRLARAPGGSVWAWSGERSRYLVQFAADGSITGHGTSCSYDRVDVNADGVRVGVERTPELRVCREGPDGSGWKVALQLEPFGGALNVKAENAIRAVASTDGGAVVMMTVAQVRTVPGLRTATNVERDEDIALLKLDANGRPQWLRVYGAARREIGVEIVRTIDGGYAVLGHSDSFDAVTPGSMDLVVLRVGPDGHVQRTLDGGDACQACLGTISGSNLREIVAAPSRVPALGTARLTARTTALAAAPPEWERDEFRRPGETNATSCRGDATNVQEPAYDAGNTEPTPQPPPGSGDAPIARFTVASLYGGPGVAPVSNQAPARFDGTASTGTGGITRYQWDFQDNESFDAEGPTPEFLYGTRGEKTARLRVTAGDGRTAETTVRFVVDPSPQYYVRVVPLHSTNEPGNSIEQVDGQINCQNTSTGVQGVCFATRNNAPGGATRLRARAAVGSVFDSWIGCDSTLAREGAPPDCVVDGDLDGRELRVEARFVPLPRVQLTLEMVGETAAGANVYSIGGEIDCPTRCVGSFVNGTSVQFQAIPARSGDFLRFEGCDAADGELCRVDVGAEARTIRAVFR